MEDKVINHFCHEHPLILTKNVGNEETLCYGCHKPVSLESAYVCSQQYCLSKTVLHKICAEIPRQIFHPSHPLAPRHPLRLFDFNQKSGWACSGCGGKIEGGLGYRCSSCDIGVDISCPQLGSIDLLEKKRLQHPSHCHPLTLMRKPAFLFDCDGCGTEDRDTAYICSTCEFWIHSTCASLPIVLPTNHLHHHHHQLFLAFSFPIEYHKFEYKCDICRKEVHMTCWVYYCGDCRYFAHVKCATSEAGEEIIGAQTFNLNIESNDGSDLIELPVHDISTKLITPFVIRENGLDEIPDIKDMPASATMPTTMASFSLLFNYHEQHPLSLVSEGIVDDEWVMICDVCVTPIYSPPYYSCAKCKYFVHSTCNLLPTTLCLDSQLYGDCLPTHPNHKLTAYTSSKLDNRALLYCQFCELYCNGRFYKCEDCKLYVDVKCASLPTTIKHSSHPQHKLIMKRRTPEFHRLCGCGSGLRSHYPLKVAYYCTNVGCDFGLHLDCALLPQNMKHEQDKHPLQLTYDASIDHPTDFYCEICEEEMHPKRWMYYCRECDHSFHPLCLTASGYHKNIKFGRQFEFDRRLHPHPLTFKLVTLKLRCDTCHQQCYKYAGFECALCNYSLCFHCGIRGLGKM